MSKEPNHPSSSYPLSAVEAGLVSEPQASPVREKSFEFAVAVVRLQKALVEHREYEVSRQLVRSGTAIGALVEEAIGAESRKDFLHKMAMAHKEARESHYWLRVLQASGVVTGLDLGLLLSQADELVALLTSITRTVKESIGR
jgi:four helix bundle protein